MRRRALINNTCYPWITKTSHLPDEGTDSLSNERQLSLERRIKLGWKISHSLYLFLSLFTCEIINPPRPDRNSYTKVVYVHIPYRVPVTIYLRARSRVTIHRGLTISRRGPPRESARQIYVYLPINSLPILIVHQSFSGFSFNFVRPN